MIERLLGQVDYKTAQGYDFLFRSRNQGAFQFKFEIPIIGWIWGFMFLSRDQEAFEFKDLSVGIDQIRSCISFDLVIEGLFILRDGRLRCWRVQRWVLISCSRFFSFQDNQKPTRTDKRMIFPSRNRGSFQFKKDLAMQFGGTLYQFRSRDRGAFQVKGPGDRSSIRFFHVSIL